MNVSQKKELEAYKKAKWHLGELQFRESSFREKLFLYVCQYSIEKMTEMRDTIWL